MGANASQNAIPDHNHPPSRALHILRVTPGSPASNTDLEAFFDFIIGIEGDSGIAETNIGAHELERIVEGHEGRTLSLLVWSSKMQSTRLVPILPSRSWTKSTQPLDISASSSSSSSASPQKQPSLLGLSMRVCEPQQALDNVWHILDVLEGSPAESAGLVPFGDYIVGWSGGILSGESDFYDLVEAHVEKPLRVYVYSYDFDTLREVVLVPNRVWGGEGLLGCGVGFGLLHRIPSSRPESDPLEELDEEHTGGIPKLFTPIDDIISSGEEETLESHLQNGQNGRHEADSTPTSLPPTRKQAARVPPPLATPGPLAPYPERQATPTPTQRTKPVSGNMPLGVTTPPIHHRSNSGMSISRPGLGLGVGASGVASRSSSTLGAKADAGWGSDEGDDEDEGTEGTDGPKGATGSIISID